MGATFRATCPRHYRPTFGQTGGGSMTRISLICAAFLLSSPAANAAMLVSDPLTETNTLQSLVREAVAAEKRVAMINNQIAQLIQIKNTVPAVSHGNPA